MKIAVCIKQVPDTAEVRLDPKTNTLIRDGIPNIINPDDQTALECALRLKEQIGATVTVVTMGPPQAENALREALAMGCDEAVHVSGREFGGSDTYATAHILAAALKKIGYDLILTGRQAIDGDTAQVGPQIAEQLNVPQVTYAESLQAQDGGALIVRRMFEDFSQLLRVKCPCLISVLSEAACPRAMTVKGTVNAYQKTITPLGFADLAEFINPQWIGLKGSPTCVISSTNKILKSRGTLLSGLSAFDAAQAIATKLEELHII